MIEMDRAKLLLDVLHGTMQLPALKLIHLSAMEELQQMNDELKPPAPEPAKSIPSSAPIFGSSVEQTPDPTTIERKI